MKTPFKIGIVGLTATLAACAGVEQRCPLTNKDGACASMQETYEIARDHGGMVGGESVFDQSRDELFVKTGGQNPSALGVEQGSTSNLEIDMGRHHLAGPVYTPPRPYRVWIAPWTDANGLVHSGEHIFFVKPGNWNYGPLGAPGAAAGLLGPALPEDYGFEMIEPGQGDDEFVRPDQQIRGTTEGLGARRGRNR